MRAIPGLEKAFSSFSPFLPWRTRRRLAAAAAPLPAAALEPCNAGSLSRKPEMPEMPEAEGAWKAWMAEAGSNNCHSTATAMKPWTWPAGKSRAQSYTFVHISRLSHLSKIPFSPFLLLSFSPAIPFPHSAPYCTRPFFHPFRGCSVHVKTTGQKVSKHAARKKGKERVHEQRDYHTI